MKGWRQLLAYIAAGLAASASVLIFQNPNVVSHESVALFPAAMAIATFVIAAWPGHADWSRFHRAACFPLAVAWAIVTIPAVITLIAVAGCACAPTRGPVGVSPSLLGLDTRFLAIGLLIAAPVLLLFAAVLPSRRVAST
jgi:hypothetical protein